MVDEVGNGSPLDYTTTVPPTINAIFIKMGTRDVHDDLHTDDDDQEDSELEDQESAKAEKWKNHYSSNHRILLVGDGDFSFSLCLARAFGSAHNLVATSLDSYG